MKTSEVRYDHLISILGKQYIKGDVQSPFDYILIAESGINARIILNFKEYFNLSRDTTADLLQVSEPTLYRWVKSNKKLNQFQSVQLFELTDLFLKGIDLFGNQADFFTWLEMSNIALGGLKPMDLLELPNGISKVADLMGRIEHGVFS